EPPPGTCYFESTRNTAIVYLILAIFEIVMLILNVYKRSGIVVTLYRDGMFYMLCILSAWKYAYSNMFDSLQLVVHSVLASRILFRLRCSNEHVHAPMSTMMLDTQVDLSMSMSRTSTV
ncbi:uncharacterized protein F5147DRAFT_687088, partial [Suillus discolor]